MPYVYVCIHKTTGQFYIGSRTTTKQTQPAHLDFPKYKTSSKTVKPNFDDFHWFVIAEFFDSKSAYDFEQQLIYENWDNPLKLNSRHTYMGGAWCVVGRKRSSEHRQKLAAGRQGKTMPDSAKQRIAEAVRSRVVSDATRRKRSEAQKGKTLSPETIAKIKQTKASRDYKPRIISKEHRKAVSAARAQQWICVSPVGDIYHITNLRSFCQQHRLQPSRMCLVAKGECKHHKGWVCHKQC